MTLNRIDSIGYELPYVDETRSDNGWLGLFRQHPPMRDVARLAGRNLLSRLPSTPNLLLTSH